MRKFRTIVVILLLFVFIYYPLTKGNAAVLDEKKTADLDRLAVSQMDQLLSAKNPENNQEFRNKRDLIVKLKKGKRRLCLKIPVNSVQ